MEFQLPIRIPPLPAPIRYGDKILLVGSCFTDHIGKRLQELKWNTLQNPHGILFDPHSVASSLQACAANRSYTEQDIFFFNELWQSWHHHSQFSSTSSEECLRALNASCDRAYHFLQQARYIIITLGSSFSYRLTDTAPAAVRNSPEEAVANCHRAPAQWFRKHLMEIDETRAALEKSLLSLFDINPGLRIIFTVSPVRHIRDGVTDNNRSKARLIEAVHQLVQADDRLYYFPAYELVIDVLRDYRFYDIDMVHPNYAATEFVMEKFIESCIEESARPLMEEVKKMVVARKHKALQPATLAHQQFLAAHRQKAMTLQQQYPFLDFSEEMHYFSGGQPDIPSPAKP